MAKKKKAGEGTLASQQRKVEVTVVKLAPYKKGDKLMMHPSTAEACVESGAVSMGKAAKAKAEEESK